MTRPLAAMDFSGLITRVDANGGDSGPVLTLGPGFVNDRSALEVRSRGVEFLLNVKLRVKFKADDKEQVFDFSFATDSREP